MYLSPIGFQTNIYKNNNVNRYNQNSLKNTNFKSKYGFNIAPVDVSRVIGTLVEENGVICTNTFATLRSEQAKLLALGIAKYLKQDSKNLSIAICDSSEYRPATTRLPEMAEILKEQGITVNSIYRGTIPYCAGRTQDFNSPMLLHVQGIQAAGEPCVLRILTPDGVSPENKDLKKIASYMEEIAAEN